MAGLFDAHTHINDSKYKELGYTPEDLVNKAKEDGLANLTCVGFDVDSSCEAVELANNFTGVYAAVGIHPTEAHKIKQADIDEIDTLANGKNVVAIGEIGLDYYLEPDHKKEQMNLVRKQIEIAIKHDLPVMFHLRDKDDSDEADRDAMDLIKEYKLKKVIIHCFTRRYEIAKEFVDLGCYLSIPGVVTFKNATPLQEAVAKISLNKLLIETDAPYLTPDPFRGRTNFPQYVKFTAEKIAALKNIDPEDVISSTSINAKNIYNIK